MSTSMRELDKISQLPDDILIEIVSTLDLKYAAQTSILAKRWRYLWTWLEDLDFGYSNVAGKGYPWVKHSWIQSHGYMNCVNQVLNAHRSPCVRKFKAYFRCAWSNNKSGIEEWVRFAFSKKVEELDLHLAIASKPFPEFDILKLPLDNGMRNLKSLRLTGVDVSGEVLESILTHCHLLEQLYVCSSDALLNLNIVSYKLKHLTLLKCKHLKEVKFDAVNMVRLHFVDNIRCVPTHMVFKNVPKLVEVICEGPCCAYPCPMLKQISNLIKQLTKLSFFPKCGFEKALEIRNQHRRTPLKYDVLFPNVKQLTLTNIRFDTVFLQLVMKTCPMLHELKVKLGGDQSLKEEAKVLKEVDLEDERNSNMSLDQKSYAEVHRENVMQGQYENKQSYPHLKLLEFAGFHGCDADAHFVLQLIACAESFETFIWDPRGGLSSIESFSIFEDIERIESIKRRACKFAKLVPPKVQVGVRGRSGISWVS